MPRKAVSDCKRIKSTTGEAGCKVWAEPLAGVRTIPTIETLKERIDGFAGRVSATRVKLTVASPPPPQLTVQTVLGPLQAAREKEASKRTTSRTLFRFIRHPTLDLVCVCHPWKG